MSLLVCTATGYCRSVTYVVLSNVGGKWTTYRHMAEETIDTAVQVCSLPATSGCRTKGLLLDGAHNWTPTMHIRLVQDFGFDVKVGWTHSNFGVPFHQWHRYYQLRTKALS